MSEIKVGDKVVRSGHFCSGLWERFQKDGYCSDDIFDVTAVSASGRYINIQNYSSEGDSTNENPGFSVYNFTQQYINPDDVLPDAPYDVEYREGTYTLRVEKRETSVWFSTPKSCVFLEPDDVLNLANDLIRMAMSLKKEMKDE